DHAADQRRAHACTLEVRLEVRAATRIATTVAAPRAAAAEQAAQLAVEVAPELVEIGWPVVATVLQQRHASELRGRTTSEHARQGGGEPGAASRGHAEQAYCAGRFGGLGRQGHGR